MTNSPNFYFQKIIYLVSPLRRQNKTLDLILLYHNLILKRVFTHCRIVILITLVIYVLFVSSTN